MVIVAEIVISFTGYEYSIAQVYFAHVVLEQVDRSPLRRRRIVFIGNDRLLLFLVGYYVESVMVFTRRIG